MWRFTQIQKHFKTFIQRIITFYAGKIRKKWSPANYHQGIINLSVWNFKITVQLLMFIGQLASLMLPFIFIMNFLRVFHNFISYTLLLLFVTHAIMNWTVNTQSFYQNLSLYAFLILLHYLAFFRLNSIFLSLENFLARSRCKTRTYLIFIR